MPLERPQSPKPVFCAICGQRASPLMPLALHEQEEGEAFWAHRACVRQRARRRPEEDEASGNTD